MTLLAEKSAKKSKDFRTVTLNPDLATVVVSYAHLDTAHCYI